MVIYIYIYSYILAHFLQLQFSCQRVILWAIFRNLEYAGRGNKSEAVFPKKINNLELLYSVYRGLQAFSLTFALFLYILVYTDIYFMQAMGLATCIRKPESLLTCIFLLTLGIYFDMVLYILTLKGL